MRGIVEFNYEFDIVKLIDQLEDTSEYSQKLNVLFVLGTTNVHFTSIFHCFQSFILTLTRLSDIHCIGQTYQYSCPFQSDTDDDNVMYRDFISSRYPL